MATSRHDARRVRDAFFKRLGDEQVFVRLFDHLPAVYLFIKDAAGRFMYLNRAMSELMGIDALAVVGQTDDAFFPPELADQYRAEDREVMAGRRTIPDRVWLVPDSTGTLRWFVSTKTPLLDRAGEAIGIAGAMQDVERSGAILGPYQQMSEVVRYVSDRYAEKITVDQLADLAHLSASQFTRRFRALFQMTPARYITRVRINAASRLLRHTDWGLTRIARETGFHDASHFVKQFKSVTGATPQKFRRAALPRQG